MVAVRVDPVGQVRDKRIENEKTGPNVLDRISDRREVGGGSARRTRASARGMEGDRRESLEVRPGGLEPGTDRAGEIVFGPEEHDACRRSTV